MSAVPGEMLPALSREAAMGASNTGWSSAFKKSAQADFDLEWKETFHSAIQD